MMVTAQRLTVIIEEKLLLKLLSFFGYGQTGAGRFQVIDGVKVTPPRRHTHC